MNFARMTCIWMLAASLGSPALAQDLPKATAPEEIGLSSARLERMSAVFRADVDKGAIPGVVVLIARNGQIGYLEAIGFQDREKQIPMRADAIFRIASMSKPITSVAIMMLVEEGKIQINDPVSTYLPEFKDVKVGVETNNETTGKPELTLETPQHVMSVQDLLRHTSGLTYGFFGASLVKQQYVDAKIGSSGDTLAEFVTKLSRLPLAYHPATTWDYGHSTDVLGRIVEVVSGMEFDQFIAERITKPLRMTDTGFAVPEQNVERVAEPQVDPATGTRVPMRNVTARPKFLSGGGGMVSTATDYARFAQMLLNGGELDGVSLLSPKTVAFMTSNHLWPGIAFSPFVAKEFGSIAPMPEQGQGFGLGFAVRTAAGRNPLPGSPGSYYWVGAYGTVFWVDPQEKLVAVMMVQLPLSQGQHYRSLIRNLVYQALMK